MNYKESGVDIDEGNRLVSFIKNTDVKKDSRVLGGIGGFAGLYDIHEMGMEHPILVSSTDGVGTKVALASEYDMIDNIGIDLVAMNVNDIICCGAKPLFFLDYYATGKLDHDKGCRIVNGIVRGCNESDMVLLGGETSEMRVVYSGDSFDLAGFVVGIVDKAKLIRSDRVNEGNVLIGIASSGLHSNGFSLVNAILKRAYLADCVYLAGMMDVILKPTKIYAKLIKYITNRYSINGIAHITGGGLVENIPRALPENLEANIKWNSWIVPQIFSDIQVIGDVSTEEMRRVFNMGIGMVLVVSKEDAEPIIKEIEEFGEKAYIIGKVCRQSGKK